MREKILILTSLFIMCSMNADAQDCKVKSFQILEGDSTARMQVYQRNDLNGVPCGLVKVLLPFPGLKFEGNVIGDVHYQNGEYWVYMNHGAYMLHIMHPSFHPLEVNLRDYGIRRVESFTTYRLQLTLPETMQSADDGLCHVTMTVSPKDAIVVIDDKPYNSDNGTVIALLPIGSHNYHVSAERYESKIATIELTDRKNDFFVYLTPRTGTLKVDYKPEGAEVWLHDRLLGRSPGTFPSVPITEEEVEIGCEGYTSRKVAVTVQEGKTTTVKGRLDKYKISDNELKNLTPDEISDLAYSYLTGDEGIAEDKEKALRYYRIAAEQGSAQAQYNLGYIFYMGQLVEQDFAEAFRWFLKAAEHGDAVSQSFVGGLYAQGKSVDVNYEQAVKWFIKSAEKNDPSGQYFLGLMYEDGTGVKKNVGKAIAYYMKAAEQGFAIAQFSLAEHYRYGIGIPADFQKARYWYEEAASQGLEIARKRMTELP